VSRHSSKKGAKIKRGKGFGGEKHYRASQTRTEDSRLMMAGESERNPGTQRRSRDERGKRSCVVAGEQRKRGQRKPVIPL